jgi:hypothetical protein
MTKAVYLSRYFLKAAGTATGRHVPDYLPGKFPQGAFIIVTRPYSDNTSRHYTPTVDRLAPEGSKVRVSV